MIPAPGNPCALTRWMSIEIARPIGLDPIPSNQIGLAVFAGPTTEIRLNTAHLTGIVAPAKAGTQCRSTKVPAA